MTLSKRSIETLVDLVEIKLSCLQVFDRDDARELAALETARSELQTIAGTPRAGEMVAFEQVRGRGRRQRVAV
jgi:hypothetical protein